MVVGRPAERVPFSSFPAYSVKDQEYLAGKVEVETGSTDAGTFLDSRTHLRDPDAKDQSANRLKTALEVRQTAGCLRHGLADTGRRQMRTQTNT